eukprot:scaffold238818_cov31-Cyclotella_meneghiniana.AAC.1
MKGLQMIQCRPLGRNKSSIQRIRRASEMSLQHEGPNNHRRVPRTSVIGITYQPDRLLWAETLQLLLSSIQTQVFAPEDD